MYLHMHCVFTVCACVWACPLHVSPVRAHAGVWQHRAVLQSTSRLHRCLQNTPPPPPTSHVALGQFAPLLNCRFPIRWGPRYPRPPAGRSWGSASAKCSGQRMAPRRNRRGTGYCYDYKSKHWQPPAPGAHHERGVVTTATGTSPDGPAPQGRDCDACSGPPQCPLSRACCDGCPGNSKEGNSGWERLGGLLGGGSILLPQKEEACSPETGTCLAGRGGHHQGWRGKSVPLLKSPVCFPSAQGWAEAGPGSLASRPAQGHLSVGEDLDSSSQSRLRMWPWVKGRGEAWRPTRRQR